MGSNLYSVTLLLKELGRETKLIRSFGSCHQDNLSLAVEARGHVTVSALCGPPAVCAHHSTPSGAPWLGPGAGVIFTSPETSWGRVHTPTNPVETVGSREVKGGARREQWYSCPAQEAETGEAAWATRQDPG